MTIAIGILAEDGVVVAADTQESIAGYMKIEQTKIHLASGSQVAHNDQSAWRGALAVSGAGWGSHIDALAHEWRREFLGLHPTADKIRETFGESLTTFYGQHVWPVPCDSRPDVQMLVAWQVDFHKGLFVTGQSTIREPFGTPDIGYAAVGAGEMFARGLLDKLYVWPMSMETAQALAIYVAWQVKRRIDGCGMVTEVARLFHNGCSRLPDPTVERAEQLFEEYADLADEKLGHLIRKSGSDEQAGEWMAARHGLSRRFSSLCREFQELLTAEMSGSPSIKTPGSDRVRKRTRKTNRA